MDCTIIGVAGGTGSGKSTFTNRLKASFEDAISVIYYDNYSLSEIAEQLEISRNGVYDSLKKSEELIEKYESLLHLSTNCNKRMHYYTLLQSLENKQVNDIVKELIDLED